MKKAAVILGLTLLLPFIGCAMARTPARGSIYTNTQGAISSGPATDWSKTGESSATSILGIIGEGDASIRRAVQDGNIEEIHHVDYRTKCILGIYCHTVTEAYGN